MQAIVTRKWVS